MSNRGRRVETPNGPNFSTRAFGPWSFRHDVTGIQSRHASYDRAIIRSGQWMLRMAQPDFLEPGCQGRLLRYQIEILDAGCEQIFSHGLKEPRVGTASSFPRKQR
jgi:hypothetical protein